MNRIIDLKLNKTYEINICDVNPIGLLNILPVY